jgi:hypothetical protein
MDANFGFRFDEIMERIQNMQTAKEQDLASLTEQLVSTSATFEQAQAAYVLIQPPRSIIG